MSRREMLATVAVILLAAALRFLALGQQSFWLDEAATVGVIDGDLGSVLPRVRDGESTPPLYYLLAWLWVQPAGLGEAGLRAFSALVGTLTVPVAIVLGRRLGGPRAGLIAGLLIAASPILVWFGQEARAYALLVLLGALTSLLVLRADDEPSRGRLLLWGVAAAAGLATHYFAVFLVAPQGLWLLTRHRRSAGWALGPPLVAALALAPLALHQNSRDGAAFIREASLGMRTSQLGKQWLVGFDAPFEQLLAVAAALLVAAGLILAVRAARAPAWPLPGTRMPALTVGGFVVAAVLAPYVLALVGEDNVLTRNFLAVLAPALCVLAVGYAAGRGVGLAAAAALTAVWVVAVIGVATDPRLQRDDWRGALRTADASERQRLVVVTPASGRLPALLYLDGARVAAAPVAPVREVVFVALPRRAAGEAPVPLRPAVLDPPAPGFTVAERVFRPTFTVVRFVSPTPVPLDPGGFVSRGLDGGPAVVLDQPARPAAIRE